MNIQIKVRCALILICVIGFLIPVSQIVNADGIHLIDKGFEVGVGYHQIGARVDNMPFDIRNVPPHPDDGGRGSFGDGPIERLKYDSNHGMNLSILYSREYGQGPDRPFRFNWGAGLEWMINFDTSIQLRNYRGAIGTEQRGYGTALTYVNIKQGGAIPPVGNNLGEIFLNWTPRLRLEIAPFGGKFRNVWLGTSASYYTIYAQNGWDRYDSLQTKDTFVFTHRFPIRTYMTIMSRDPTFDMRIGLTAGVQFQPGTITDKGREADFSSKFMVFFAGIVYRF
ncbi:MAG: hypothetical protein A2928_04045 [Candidatus Taylorbacteria bacterium RIFCSPLOWO2_01_FULL_45_15b]|uniref:Uncharacterized protein n=1 Tax=Candidatus Taylorbacteria bacterium RIFCSPLOWO2_01_FULL_45_15b TaxID=1802319 RepID=A0A1G2NI87_9BACT|nr:MAG: hypothetical protein A2928_04045 [Candidatus Taylorbacteria bacterium RIFCSPLOWO2_01_FULL_45_15b]